MYNHITAFFSQAPPPPSNQTETHIKIIFNWNKIKTAEERQRRGGRNRQGTTTTYVCSMWLLSRLWRNTGKGSTNYSLPVLFCCCFLWIPTCVHQFHSFRPKISPKWLSGLRWLGTSVPWWVACAHVSLLRFHTMPGGSPLWFHWVKGVCMSSCNLPPALWAKWLHIRLQSQVVSASHRWPHFSRFNM